MRKRITSLFLVLALCLTLLPTAALAEEASSVAQETQDSTEVSDGCTIEEDTAVQGKGENDKAVQTVQALIDALPAAEDISDANADEVSGQLDAIDEAKQALTEEQAAQLDFAKYDAAAAAVLALAGEPDANEPAVLADTIGTQPSGSGTACGESAASMSCASSAVTIFSLLRCSMIFAASPALMDMPMRW